MTVTYDSETNSVVQPRCVLPVAGRAHVVVAGGSPTGICAAVAAARLGCQVLLVERYGFLGGTTTAGMSNTPCCADIFDRSGEQLVGGLPLEILKRGVELGGTPLSWDVAMDPQELQDLCIPYDTEVLKQLYMEVLETEGVAFLLHSLVIDTILEGNRAKGLVVQDKAGRSALLGDVVIDATGDGSVAAYAGAAFLKRDKEVLFRPGMHVRIAGIDLERLLNYVSQNPGFFQLTANGIRATRGNRVTPDLTIEQFTDRVRRGQPWAVSGLQPLKERAQAEGVFISPTGVKTRSSLTLLHLGNGILMHFAGGVDGRIDPLAVGDLTLAETEVRKHMWRLLRFYQKQIPGFESAYMLETPPEIGVRETRHIIGAYTLSDDDVRQSRRFSDSIGRIRGHDSRPVVESWFEVPYRCLVPEAIDNLLIAGRCISADGRVSIDALRGIITGMVTGQAAGTAAALAIRHDVPPRELAVNVLRRTLRASGAIV